MWRAVAVLLVLDDYYTKLVNVIFSVRTNRITAIQASSSSVSFHVLVLHLSVLLSFT